MEYRIRFHCSHNKTTCCQSRILWRPAGAN